MLFEHCNNCDSTRMVEVNAKCGGTCTTEVNGLPCEDYYVPEDMGIGGGDYLRFKYCLECGQMGGQFPVPLTAIEDQVSYA